MDNTEPKLEYASILLVNKSGEIMLQLRDDNPAIADPNCLSLFAGRLEPGETPKQAVIREAREETTLELADVTFLFTYHDPDIPGKMSHVFIAHDIDESAVTVHEGQGYRTIVGPQDLERYDFAPISKNILAHYFQNYSVDHKGE